MADRKTILFFPFNLLSHYLRCLVLAGTYDNNIYRICFLSSTKYNHFVYEHGYEIFHCDQFDPEAVLNCAKRFDFSWMNQQDLEKIMLAQVDTIRAENAALVIGDVAPTLRIAAELTDVIHLSLLNGYMTRYYARTRKISRTHKAYRLLKCFPEVLADPMTRLGEQLAFRRIQRPFNRIREKYRLPKRSDYLSEIEGMQTLICDMPALFPQKELPPSFRIIGPLIYQPADSDHHFELRTPKPVICICMGSSGDWKRLHFLNDSYYAKYTIVTAGDTDHVLSADHVVAREFVNLNQLLQHCGLMICHGGNGTIYTAIENGVYMLCLSNHFEQEWNIAAVERNGYGRSADRFTEADWRLHIDAQLGLHRASRSQASVPAKSFL